MLPASSRSYLETWIQQQEKDGAAACTQDIAEARRSHRDDSERYVIARRKTAKFTGFFITLFDVNSNISKRAVLYTMRTFEKQMSNPPAKLPLLLSRYRQG